MLLNHQLWGQLEKLTYFFPFNNSALFVDPSKSTFVKMFWEMGYASLANFFVKFDQAKGVSLQLTREVLEERHQLETIVLGIREKINAGLAYIDKYLLDRNKSQMAVIARMCGKMFMPSQCKPLQMTLLYNVCQLRSCLT